MKRAKRVQRERQRALESGWNNRAAIVPSRNNEKVCEVHRSYFDKSPGQLYGGMLESEMTGKHVSDWGGGHTTLMRRSRRRSPGKSKSTGALQDQSQFIVVVHVRSTSGERVPGSRVIISAKASGKVVGSAVADEEGRAVTVCHHNEWPTTAFHMEASADQFAPSSLDFEATARECAAQISLESDADAAQRQEMARLAQEESRRAARSRFIVHALVTNSASGRPVQGATVVVCTAQNGTLAGSGLTDDQGKVDVDCRHPQWASTPMRAQVTAPGFVATGMDLHPTGPDISTVIRMEADDDKAAREAGEAAKFTVVVLARHRATGRAITGAAAVLRVKESGATLASSESNAEGKAVLAASHPAWAETPMVLDVSGRGYVPVSGNVNMVAKAQQVEVELDLQSEVDAAAAEAEAARKAAADAERSAADAKAAAEAKRQREAEEAAAAEAEAAARARAEEAEKRRLAELEAHKFSVMVWCTNVKDDSGEEGCKVTISDRSSGDVLGTGTTNSAGKALVKCSKADWDGSLMTVEAEKGQFETGVTNIAPTGPMTETRVHMEPIVKQSFAKASNFSLTVYTFDESTDKPLAGSTVQLRDKATGEDVGDGITGEDGICHVLGDHDEWASAAMYLEVVHKGYASKGSDINLSSRENRTDVGMVPTSQDEALRKMRREATLKKMGADAMITIHTSVVHAVTLEPVPGVEVDLNIVRGKKNLCTEVSNEQGIAEIVGFHRKWNKTEMVITPKVEGMIGIPQTLLPESHEFSIKAIVCPLPPKDTVRVVCAWGAEPSDLDLIGLTPSGKQVSFDMGSDPESGCSFPGKEQADFGPETIDIALGTVDDWIRIVVTTPEGKRSVAHSRGTVTVITADGVAEVFKVPFANVDEDVWDICAIHGRTGNVYALNYVIKDVPDRLEGMRGVTA